MFVAIVGNPCQRMYIPTNVYASICLKFIFKKTMYINTFLALKSGQYFKIFLVKVA